MPNQTLVERILQKCESASALAKMAGIEDTAPAEGVVSEHVKNPADGEIGVVADIHTNVHENEEHELPGAASDIIENKPDDGSQQGADVTVVPTNEDINAEEVLNAVNKTASAIRNIAAKIGALSVEEIDAAFSKQASAEDMTAMVEEYIAKQADAGDPACQALIDYTTSFHLGMMKRANDQAELEAAGVDPEVADAELQAAAEENPAGILMDAEGVADEGIDPELLAGMTEEEAAEGAAEGAAEADAEAIAQEMSAEIEAEAVELTEAIAADILEQDPSISEEEALEAAAAQVADAIDTAIAQQAVGAIDENGEYTMADEDAAGVVSDLEKTASAFPMRGVLTKHFNDRFGLNPEMFAKRLGF